MAMDSFIIRPAERKDINELWNMIEVHTIKYNDLSSYNLYIPFQELGHYERMPGPALNNPSGLYIIN